MPQVQTSVVRYQKSDKNNQALGTRHQVRGFTLIELMVAITIVAILSAIGMTTYGQAQSAARDAKRKSHLDDIKKAMYQYQADNGTFCLIDKGGCNGGQFWDIGGGKSWNNNADAAKLLPYLGGTGPRDPKFSDSNNDYYIYIDTDTTFTLSATLENGPSTLPSCSLTGIRNYCIKE